jgi:MFS family permease
MVQIDERPTYRGLLRIPAFVRLWSGASLSFLGDGAARVALPVLALAITGQPAILGIVFAVQALPWLVVSPLAGLLADVADRRRVLRTALVAEALAVAAMTVASSGWQLLALAFLAGALQVVRAPASAGALPRMVGPHLPLAFGLTAATVQVTDVVGQAVTGLLLLEVSARTVLIANAATFIVYAFLVPPLPNAEQAEGREPLLRRLSAGVRTVWGLPELRYHVVVMVLRGITVTASLSLLYALVTERHSGPTGFGLTSAAFAGALVLGSLRAGQLAARGRPAHLLWLTTAVSGLAMVPLALPLPLPAAAAILVVVGLLYAPGNVVANSEIARLAPDHLRGQVVSASWALIKSGQVAGGLLAAVTVGHIGAGGTMTLAGVVLAAAMAVLRPRPALLRRSNMSPGAAGELPDPRPDTR